MAYPVERVRVGDGAGIELSVTVAGNRADPAVMLLHGFPEIGFSWRHQITVLADAGYRVIVPDQRGFGESDRPEAVEDYDVFQLTGDLVGLLDALKIDDVTLVGHDWGSIVAWHLGLFRPDLLRGLVLMSVPYVPRFERSMPAHIAETDPEGPFSYMVAFQDQDNPIEDLFDADVSSMLRAMLWAAGGEEADPAQPDALPSFIDAADFEVYCDAFASSGFVCGINWYRNMDRNWRLTRPWHQALITVPSLFIGGSADFVVQSADQSLGDRADPMGERFTDFRGSVIIDGAGHWLQQEAPYQVNTAILEFLSDVN